MRYGTVGRIAVTLAVAAVGAFDGVSARTLTLNEAVALALDNNEDLLIAREEVVRGKERIREGVSQALPRVTLDSRYNKSWMLPQIVFDTPDGRQTFEIGTTHNITTGLSLRQTLYAAGKVGAGIRVARDFRRYTQAGLDVVTASTIAQTEMAFYDLILARELVSVSKESLADAKRNLARVASLRRAGRVSDYDLLRARLRVSELRPDSLAAEKQLQLAGLHLRDAIGLDHSEVIEPQGALRSEPRLPLDDVEVLVEKGLRDRAEIHQMAFEQRMRKQAIRIQRSNTLPKLELFASGQLEMQSNDLRFGTDERQQSWMTGATLTFPLFDGFETKARVGQARVDVRQAELQYRKLRKQVRTEVERAWFEAREGLQRVDAREAGLREAEEGAKIARSRYAQGVGTQLEVLDAEVVLSRSRVEMLRARRDLAAALVNLELAVGMNPMLVEEAGE